MLESTKTIAHHIFQTIQRQNKISTDYNTNNVTFIEDEKSHILDDDEDDTPNHPQILSQILLKGSQIANKWRIYYENCPIIDLSVGDKKEYEYEIFTRRFVNCFYVTWSENDPVIYVTQLGYNLIQLFTSELVLLIVQNYIKAFKKINFIKQTKIEFIEVIVASSIDHKFSSTEMKLLALLYDMVYSRKEKDDANFSRKQWSSKSSPIELCEYMMSSIKPYQFSGHYHGNFLYHVIEQVFSVQLTGNRLSQMNIEEFVLELNPNHHTQLLFFLIELYYLSIMMIKLQD